MMYLAAWAAALILLCTPAAGQGPPSGGPPGMAGSGDLPGAPATPPGLASQANAQATNARPLTTTVTTTATTPVAFVATTAAQPVAAASTQTTTATRAAGRAQPPRRKPAARKMPPPRSVAAPVVMVQRTRARPRPVAVRRAAQPQTKHTVSGRARAAKPESAPPREPITRTITRSVRDIVHVFPAWAKLLIGALGALLLLAGGILGLTALRNRRLERQRAELLAQVGVLQQALLPAVPEHVGALAVSVAYRPAAGLAAGGDFYDAFELDRGRTAIILGDVSGHGHESLAPATFIRHMVRSYLEAGMPPRAALQLAGNVLDDQSGDDFATIVAAVHDPAAGTLSYATAGHPPPIITGPAAFEPLTVACSPPAGCGYTTGLRQTTVALPPGSAVCFFTDGLIEARVGRRVFGRERLAFALDELPPDAKAADVVDLVGRATQRLRDDVAVCLIRTGPEATPGTVRVEELEVTWSDLHTERLRRFFEACDVRPVDAAAAIKAASPHLAGLQSVLMRVRLAHHRSGVDVVPVGSATTGAEVVPVNRTR
jgi:Stage II sporulation protein E (SpoIIE)